MKNDQRIKAINGKMPALPQARDYGKMPALPQARDWVRL